MNVVNEIFGTMYWALYHFCGLYKYTLCLCDLRQYGLRFIVLRVGLHPFTREHFTIVLLRHNERFTLFRYDCRLVSVGILYSILIYLL